MQRNRKARRTSFLKKRSKLLLSVPLNSRFHAGNAGLVGLALQLAARGRMLASVGTAETPLAAAKPPIAAASS